jgi:hypothetical protein
MRSLMVIEDFIHSAVFINFMKPQDGDHSSSGVVRNEGFDDGGDLLLLAARQSRGGFE